MIGNWKPIKVRTLKPHNFLLLQLML